MQKKFNVNQKLAVTHGDGPCLVIAGPGSGKTYVLTNRILNLILDKNVNPDCILIITFTRAAANEMQQRFFELVNDEGIKLIDLPTFGTFHSVFYDILRNDFGYNSKSLIDSKEEKVIISELLEKYRNINVTSNLILNIQKDIRNYKLYEERNEKYIPKYLGTHLFNKIYKSYQEELFDKKRLDFSDMISKCYELLKKNNKVLKYYQNKYKYILIDEFQDINKMQYELIKLICKNKNIFVVGDDDQSIYKFRGSYPKVIIDFLRDYKKTKVIYLSENYRCTKQIVKFSKLVIDHNKDRFPKNLVSNRSEFGKLEIKAFVDSSEENKYILELIKNKVKKGDKLSSIAILYRTNLLANSIRSVLDKNNIKYIIKGEDRSIYDHFAIKDIISYLRVSVNDNYYENLVNIANKPLRYISRDSLSNKVKTIDDLIKYYIDKDYILEKLYKLKDDLNIICKTISPLAIRYIRCNIGYDKYVKEYCSRNGIDYDEVMEYLDAFEEEAISFKDIKSYLKYIDDSKKQLSEKDLNEDAVKLMTFHLSKGLEFKTVFIIDANDGLIPHKKSIRESDLETERRLFYVAMTRAKDNLHIYFTTRRFGKNFKPSRFIIESIGG